MALFYRIAFLTLVFGLGLGAFGCDGESNGGDDTAVDGGGADSDTGPDTDSGSDTESDVDTDSQSDSDSDEGACESMVEVLCAMACDCANGGDYMYYYGTVSTLGSTGDPDECVEIELSLWVCDIPMDFDTCTAALASAQCGELNGLPGLALPEACRAVVEAKRGLGRC